MQVLQPLEWVWQDLRYAFRGLLRSPAFAATAIVSLALGIGANTAIFSFVNAILLKRLPVPEPERLVTFAQTYHGESSRVVWRMRTLDEMAKRTSAFGGIFGRMPKAVSFSKGDTPQWLMGELVTGQYFQTLEAKPAIGRVFIDDDVRNAGGNPVCVISYGLWQREFAGNPGVSGQNVFLNGHGYRILGVTGRGFWGSDLEHRFDVWIPATRIGDFMPAFGDATGVDWLKTLSWLSPMARLKPGVTRIQAEVQAQRVFQQIERENAGGHTPDRPTVLQLKDGSQGLSTMRAAFGRPALVLMAVVALVLLIACANLANLLLARAQARPKEFEVRASIGASRARLVRQLLMESLLLAALGGVAGIALSFWVSRTLLTLFNVGKASWTEWKVTPDLTVLGFSIALVFATAILFGLFPAWQATRPGVSAGSGRKSPLLLRRALVIVQIALSLVVVFAAGLLTQTLRTLMSIDLGFRPGQVVALRVDPAANGHSSAAVTMILDELLRRARALPGVRAASLASSVPNGSMAISMSVGVPGYTPKQTGDDIVAFNFISPDYFATLGQGFLQGRDFNDRDRMNSPRVAIVTEKFGRRYFGDRDPLGRKFRQGGGDIEIVGVVQDARDQSVRNGPEPTVYLPEKQGQTSGLTILVLSQREPAGLIPSLLTVVRSIDPRMPVYSVHTLDADVGASLSTEKILGYLSTLFALLAIALASVGLYGVMAYSVLRRTREIGVRFAVGAQRGDVAGLFARESLALMIAGLGLGAPIALVSGRALKRLLFGVAGTDPLTLFFSLMVLAAAVLLAMAIPLWRAASVSPTVALRYE
jgi:predicted permease